MNGILEILLILSGIDMTTSDHGVQFLLTDNHDQLITSSTLKWVSAENGKKPPHAVVGSTKHLSLNETDSNIYVCRAMHNAEWIPGQLIPEEKVCYISLLGLVKPYAKYEVLQNVDNGSRLIWTEWDVYHTFPSGMVAGGINLYIARKKVEELEDKDVLSSLDRANSKSVGEFSHYMGKFNSKDAFGSLTLLTEDKQEQRYTKGELLIELEPVRYELNNVKYTMSRKKIEKKEKLLAFITLKNDEEKALQAESVLAYDDFYSSYWGQGSAMLRGLTTVIRNATGGKFIAEIKWGIEENKNKKNLYKVESFLQPGTACNVSLWGNETKSELPYSGTLISFYKDGTTTFRKIYGTRRLIETTDVKPELGPSFFIQNQSIIPMITTSAPNAIDSGIKLLNDFEGKVKEKKYSTVPPHFIENEPNELWTKNGALSLRENKTLPEIQLVKNGENSFCFLSKRHKQFFFLLPVLCLLLK